MLAEVRLLIGQREARLIVKHGESLVEDEIWTFAGPISQTESREVVKTVFDSTYDLLNFVTNGGDE